MFAQHSDGCAKSRDFEQSAWPGSSGLAVQLGVGRVEPPYAADRGERERRRCNRSEAAEPPEPRAGQLKQSAEVRELERDRLDGDHQFLVEHLG